MTDETGAEGPGGVAASQLRAIIERIERLEEEKREIADQVKEVYAEAKANGFDTKTLRKVVGLRKKNLAGASGGRRDPRALPRRPRHGLNATVMTGPAGGGRVGFHPTLHLMPARGRVGLHPTAHLKPAGASG